MSQSGPSSSVGSGGAPTETITGNSGGAVAPDASFNINLFGDTMSGITVSGSPATHTLTITAALATTSQLGVVTLATNAEAIAGTDSNKAIVSSALAAKLGAQTLNGIAYGNGTSSAIGWTSALTNGQLLIGDTGNPPALATLTAGSGISIANGTGTITISASGSSVLNYTSVNSAASPYTVSASDDYLGVDTTLGTVTIRLPNAPTSGRTFVVKDKEGTSATNAITVTTVGGAINIDGATTYTINSAYQAIELIFNGATYEIF